MQIKINIEDDTPQFAQLIDQLKDAVLKGYIKPGDSLPSIRQLANDLGLNNKTVAKAYQLLERDSIIQAKGYRGSFVHPDAVKNCTFDLNAWVDEKINEMIKTLKDAGVTDSEIRIAFTQAMKK